MSALVKDRNTQRRQGEDFEFDVKAATKIYAGALVALDATGNAAGGVTATTLVAVGMASAFVDNSAGAAGDLKVKVRKGVFRFGNSAAADEITKAEIGDVAYIVDDQTVAKTNGSSTRSAAGTIADVDAQGVWVKFD